MEAIGINIGYLLVQCGLPLLFIAIWFLLALAALRQLRQRPLSDVAQAVWAVLIVGVPLLGAAAFFIVQPGLKSVS
jgi:hypothetical protein